MIVLTDDLLLNYTRCNRRAYLTLHGDRSQRTAEKEFVLKLRREHQRLVQDQLAGQTVVTPDYAPKDWQAGAEQTEHLMMQGVEKIHRGILYWDAPLSTLDSLTTTPQAITAVGRPTLLVKQAGASRFGDWCYRPVNIKLGKRPKSEYKIVAAFQAILLANVQAASPTLAELILRDGGTYRVDLSQWEGKSWEVMTNCVTLLEAGEIPEVFISRQRCSLCPWYDHCHQEAAAAQHLSLVPGVTPSRYSALQGLGVTELAQLAQLDPQRLEPEVDGQIAAQMQQQALALVDDRALPTPEAVVRSHRFPPLAPIELYFDLEAEPDRNVDFLFGVLCVNHVKQTETFHGFFAEKPEDEPLIWQQFLALLHRYPTAPIVHFSAYEVETIKRFTKRYRMSQYPLKTLLPRFIDTHDWLMKLAVLPVESYSLKSVAKWLGFTWRDEGLSGDQTVCLYEQWLEFGDQAAKETIIRYNEDDCRATHKLRVWLTEWHQSLPHFSGD
jgi:uncharacterized protein